MRAVLSYRLQCKSQQLFCPQIFHLSRRRGGSPLLCHLESAGDVQPGAWNYLKVWSLTPWTDAASRLRPQLGLPARTHTCSLPTWPGLPQNEEAGSRAESPGERARRRPSVCHDLVWRVTPLDSHACLLLVSVSQTPAEVQGVSWWSAVGFWKTTQDWTCCSGYFWKILSVIRGCKGLQRPRRKITRT